MAKSITLFWARRWDQQKISSTFSTMLLPLSSEIRNDKHCNLYQNCSGPEDIGHPSIILCPADVIPGQRQRRSGEMEVPNKDVTCATMLWSHKHCKKIAIIWDRKPTPWKYREITNSLQPVWIWPQPCLQTALAPHLSWLKGDRSLTHYVIMMFLWYPLVPFLQISNVRARQVADKTRVRHISRPHNFPNLQSRVQSDGLSVEGPILRWESVWYCLEPSLKKDLCTQAITAHTEGQLGIANCRKGVFMCFQIYLPDRSAAALAKGPHACKLLSCKESHLWFLSSNLVRLGVEESQVQQTHLVSWSLSPHWSEWKPQFWGGHSSTNALMGKQLNT